MTDYSLLQEIITLHSMWPRSFNTVFTNGCFDILHPGHVQIIQRCAEMAGRYGVLVVGINDDDSVFQNKGRLPVVCLEDRIFMIRNIATAHVQEFFVIPFKEETPRRLIQAVQPDVIVKGGDYEPADVVGADLAKVVIYQTPIKRSSSAIQSRLNA